MPPWFVTDRWGNTLVYEVAPNGSAYTVRSMGPDGVDGTSDDVTFEHIIEEPGYQKELPPGDPAAGSAGPL